MWKRLHVKYPLFLSDFNKNWIFSKYFRKRAQVSNLIKICPVGAELFHTDGRTDRQTDRRTGGQKRMTKLVVACRNFANMPTNENYLFKHRLQGTESDRKWENEAAISFIFSITCQVLQWLSHRRCHRQGTQQAWHTGFIHAWNVVFGLSTGYVGMDWIHLSQCRTSVSYCEYSNSSRFP